MAKFFLSCSHLAQLEKTVSLHKQNFVAAAAVVVVADDTLVVNEGTVFITLHAFD